MKIVSAYIRPFLLDDVRDALTAIGIQGLSAYEVKGFGRQRGHPQTHRAGEQTTAYIPKIKIELLVSDDIAPTIVQTILQFGRTGNTGDGKVYVLNVEDVYAIRTGQADTCML